MKFKILLLTTLFTISQPSLYAPLGDETMRWVHTSIQSADYAHAARNRLMTAIAGMQPNTRELTKLHEAFAVKFLVGHPEDETLVAKEMINDAITVRKKLAKAQSLELWMLFNKDDRYTTCKPLNEALDIIQKWSVHENRADFLGTIHRLEYGPVSSIQRMIRDIKRYSLKNSEPLSRQDSDLGVSMKLIAEELLRKSEPQIVKAALPFTVTTKSKKAMRHWLKQTEQAKILLQAYVVSTPYLAKEYEALFVNDRVEKARTLIEASLKWYEKHESENIENQQKLQESLARAQMSNCW